MKLRVGLRLRSAVDNTEIIVLRAPATDLLITCGGQPMIALNAVPPLDVELDPAEAEGTELGKRYDCEEAGVEVLCARNGRGSLAVDGRPLRLKAAKPLPASD